MSTLLEVKQAAANYLNIGLSDLTQNGQDLFLIAANEVRKMAELANDFEFSRKTLRVTVNGLTGGNLALAQDSLGNTYEVKTVIEAGLLDTSGNLCPVEWTTTSESLTRQREDNSMAWPRYPSDGWANSTPYGGMRFTFSGNAISKWPLVSETNATDYPLYLEGYTFGTDWTSANLGNSSVTVSGGTTLIRGTYLPVGVNVNNDIIYLLADHGIISSNASSWFIKDFTANSSNPYWQGSTLVGTYVAYDAMVANATVVLNTTSYSDVWTTHGQKYLLWATLVQLNHRFRRWVPRQEGNLPPPTQLAEEGLQALIAWDAYRFEGFRTHNR